MCTVTSKTLEFLKTIFLFRSGIAFYFHLFSTVQVTVRPKKKICVFTVTFQKNLGNYYLLFFKKNFTISKTGNCDKLVNIRVSTYIHICYMLFNQQQCFIYSTASFLSKLRAKKVEKLCN
jgi:hypothetical protein